MTCFVFIFGIYWVMHYSQFFIAAAVQFANYSTGLIETLNTQVQCNEYVYMNALAVMTYLLAPAILSGLSTVQSTQTFMYLILLWDWM